ncbi:MAG: diguanylate cyclase [Bacillota bacterium]|nr:diguanylate cyclase [Bacillota bacterium]
MDTGSLTRIIVDESDAIIYLADMDNFELIYANKKVRELYGFKSEEDYIGKKCYKLLQHKDEPCEFCTNDRLRTDKFYCWEVHNPLLDAYCYVKDKMILLDGKRVRLEIATDLSETAEEKRRLKEQLTVEKTLIRCIHTLSENNDIDTAINQLLEIIGEYYCADRAYIFEICYETNTTSNTYEWCSENIHAEKDSLQNVPLPVIDGWLNQFKKRGEFFITSLGKNVDKSCPEYKILERQGIESLVTAPLMEDGEITGFIGIDNPKVNSQDTKLLRSVSFFVRDDIAKKRLMQELELMSYYDTLTGLGNRNKYIDDVRKMEEEPPESLGTVFLDLNGLKEVNDTQGHDQGDRLLCEAAELLKRVFPDGLYRVGGDEFVCICYNIEEDKFNERLDLLREIIEESNISVSLGSHWTTGKMSVSAEISKADELMYSEKKSYYRRIRNQQRAGYRVSGRK